MDSQFSGDIIKSFYEDNNIAFFIEANVKFSKNLDDSQNYVSLLAERIKVEKVQKVEKDCSQLTW